MTPLHDLIQLVRQEGARLRFLPDEIELASNSLKYLGDIQCFEQRQNGLRVRIRANISERCWIQITCYNEFGTLADRGQAVHTSTQPSPPATAHCNLE